jgi:protein translocase SecG subunit
MTTVQTFLPYIQIGLAILIIAGVLLQQSETSLGGAFGAGDSGNAFHTRRGLEKVLFIGTLVVSILFVATCFIALVI